MHDTKRHQLRMWRTGSSLLIAGLLAVSFLAAAPATAAGNKYVAISAGYSHTCALTSRGAAYCWGNDNLGQLGNGDAPTDSDVPVAVVGGRRFASISVGDYHTCAITTRGAAYCWGSGSSGQLGDGDDKSRSTPVAVAGSLRFASINTGYYHSCAITSSGAAYCWGSGGSGQLGDGDDNNRSTPVAVAGGLRFKSIDGGYYHTCALTTRGAAYCWGRNNFGQLGDGDAPTDSDTPVAVVGGRRFASIGAGNWHTCAVTTRGVAYCWGYNGDGQLGDGNDDTDSEIPVAVVGGRRFASISAGELHTCALTKRGVAYCWGYNDPGQLGDGNGGTDSDIPEAVIGGRRFASISAGGYHTCARTTRGAALCWGENGDGQLGDGNYPSTSDVPVAVQ